MANFVWGVSANIALLPSGKKSFLLTGRNDFSRVEVIPVQPAEVFAYESQIHIAQGDQGDFVGFLVDRPERSVGYANVFLFSNNATFRFHGRDCFQDLGTWSAGTYYTLRLDMDFSDNTGTISVNGEVKPEKVPIHPRSFYSKEFHMNFSLDKFGAGTQNNFSKNGGEGSIYIDQIKFFQ
ncbi:MAG: hypothetical protein HQM08_24865 [Candidatus Riflebacteria bacterium]|nr:hypothetical protein [Candidatus Riflebacteria bacterium]